MANFVIFSFVLIGKFCGSFLRQIGKKFAVFSITDLLFFYGDPLTSLKFVLLETDWQISGYFFSTDWQIFSLFFCHRVTKITRLFSRLINFSIFSDDLLTSFAFVPSDWLEHRFTSDRFLLLLTGKFCFFFTRNRLANFAIFSSYILGNFVAVFWLPVHKAEFFFYHWLTNFRFYSIIHFCFLIHDRLENFSIFSIYK